MMTHLYPLFIFILSKAVVVSPWGRGCISDICVSDICIAIHKRIKIIVTKRQQNKFMVGGRHSMRNWTKALERWRTPGLRVVNMRGLRF